MFVIVLKCLRTGWENLSTDSESDATVGWKGSGDGLLAGQKGVGLWSVMRVGVSNYGMGGS